MKQELDEPILSIAILTFNRPEYLNQLLNSIEVSDPETKSKIEIIVLNNGSTDNTVEVISQHQKRLSIHEINNSTNIRGTRSFLKLIDKARGTFIIFPGDDDVFCETAIDKLLSTLSGMAEDVSLVAARAQVIDQNGARLNISYKPKKYASQTDLLATLIDKSVLWFPATAIKTNVLKNNFLPDSLTAFDWYVWILACTQGKIELLEDEIIKYRKHTDKEQNSFLEENWEIDALLMFSYAVNGGAISDWLKSCDLNAVQEFVRQLAKNSATEDFSFQNKMKYIMLFQAINKSFDLNMLLEDVNFNFIEKMDPRFKQSLLGLSTSIEDFKSLFLNAGIEFAFNSKPKGVSNFIEVIPKHDGFNLVKNHLGIESSIGIPKKDPLIYYLFNQYNEVLRTQRENEKNQKITKFELKVINVIRAIKRLKNRKFIFKKW
jgi:glycosyltransferase involved in cell wall biosynthesis